MWLNLAADYRYLVDLERLPAAGVDTCVSGMRLG
jgi:hypothetical protein